MGDEQKQLTDEQKKQLKSQVKSTKQYREMMAYKNFFEGTDNYFNQINDIQVNIMEENKKLLNELGDYLVIGFQDILDKKLYSEKKIKKRKEADKNTENQNSQEESHIGDEEIDLTFYENDKENNIDGLKDAVKELIKQSKDKEVTKILKNLLTRITPIIDTMGKNLKNYKLNTRFDDLLDKYNKLKNKALGNDKTGGKNKGEGKTENENENETENKPNKEVYAEKSTVEKGQEKLLRAGLFPVEAREKGLLPPEGETEKTKEKKPINREELQGIINQNALENSTDDIIKPAAKLADAMHLKSTEVTPKEKAEPEETTETKENEIPTTPTISNETKTTQENNTPKIDDKQYEYELLRTDYINKIEAQLVPAIRAINAVLTQEQKEKGEKEEKAIIKKVKKKLKNREKVLPKDVKPAEVGKENESIKNLKHNIDLNTNICKFLLKLLRRDETSINTKVITDIFMAHKMMTYGGINDKDEITGKDQILLEMMFEDKSKRDTYDSKDKFKLNNYEFARFLFRIYFIIKNNIPVNELDNPNKTHTLDTEFETSYRDMCIAANDTDHTQFSEALDFLNDEINETLNPKNSNEKTTKKPETDNSEFYKIIQECIPKIKNGNTSLKPTEVISRLLRECKQKDIANRLINNLKHPIFESSKYFNIEKNDTDLQF